MVAAIVIVGDCGDPEWLLQLKFWGTHVVAAIMTLGNFGGKLAVITLC